ncbi:hypothetical protein GNZ18_24500 [Actinomadura sp. NEAU-AAG5]|uniref:Neocarzinostatin family protein n=1 Tax=Actinomadura litoris TaxID=2678616 RepID=A0A7K1L5N5_9ACTN|nr:hypothetical protein [Actinomadura litoris]
MVRSLSGYVASRIYFITVGDYLKSAGMEPNIVNSLLVRTGAATAAGLAVALAAPYPSLAAARGREVAVTVRPSTSLAETARVEVSGDGLDPEDTYYAQQCGAVEEGEPSCDQGNRVRITPDGNGAFRVALTVHRRFEAASGDRPRVAVDCAQVGCTVGVGDEDGEDAGSVPVSFR